MSMIASLRPVEAHELTAVSGGEEDEIVVVGARRSSSIDTADFLAFRAAFDASLFGPMGCFGGGGGGVSQSPYPPDEDQDGDGIPNWEEDPIIVVAPGTPSQAAIAVQLADRDVGNFLFMAGAMSGWIGMGLYEALIFAGVSRGVAAAIVGGATASGAPTSVADVLAEGRENLFQRISVEYIHDIQNNPQRYATWMQNPLTGEWFDAMDRRHNQWD